MNYTQNEKSLTTYSEITEERPYNNDIIKETFLKNIILTEKVKNVNIIHGFSHEEIPKLIVSNKNYDLIFIDGNHTSSFVITDAIMAWQCLKNGGIMVFDDYRWMMHKKETERPMLAIDSFIKIFNSYLKVLHIGDKVFLQKNV
jgi:predicted O-methyltransferase YrrM